MENYPEFREGERVYIDPARRGPGLPPLPVAELIGREGVIVLPVSVAPDGTEWARVYFGADRPNVPLETWRLEHAGIARYAPCRVWTESYAPPAWRVRDRYNGPYCGSVRYASYTAAAIAALELENFDREPAPC